MQIGPHRIEPRVVLAPMAGVTDKPFRLLCKRLGAGLAVSEMTTSDPRFWHTAKSTHRMDHVDEPDPVSVQIAGTVPAVMAEAARHNVDHGAQIIDINMGCPAKKVCNAWAGSALMREPELVARILEAVVRAVDVPVTLKIRTGWDRDNRNGVNVARIAEQAGIAALSVHGRTRADLYTGEAEYATIAAIREAVDLPLFANGDIDSPHKARAVLDATGADAVMIGRAAQGRPWMFGEISHYLETGEHLPPPEVAEIHRVLVAHLHDLYGFYGEHTGVRVARKHISWYTKGLAGSAAFRHYMNQLPTPAAQVSAVDEFFNQLADCGRYLIYVEECVA